MIVVKFGPYCSVQIYVTGPVVERGYHVSVTTYGSQAGFATMNT